MTYYALLLFFVFEYVRPGAYIPGLDLLHLNAIIPIGAALGTLVGRAPVSNGRFFADDNTKLIGALLALLAVSTLFAEVTMTAYTVTKNVFSYIVIYWILVRQVGTERRLKGVFVTMVGVHLAIAALNPGVFASDDGRVGINSGAFLGDGNDFSLSINMCIPLCLYLVLESRKTTRKLFWSVALVALVMCVVATKSRGGTLALGAIGVYFWLKSPRKVLTASAVLVLVGLVLVWAPPSYFERMGMMTDTQEGSAQGRIIAWKAAVQMALANPILGAGAGHFAINYGTHYHVDGTPWLTAHSIYFLLLGELGFPGLAVLLTLIFSNLAANRRLSGEARAVDAASARTARNLLACTSASLVAFAAGGAFLSAAYYPHLYVVSGMLTSARLIGRQLLSEADVVDESSTHRDEPVPARRVRSGAISPDWRPSHAAGQARRMPTDAPWQPGNLSRAVTEGQRKSASQPTYGEC